MSFLTFFYIFATAWLPSSSPLLTNIQSDSVSLLFSPKNVHIIRNQKAPGTDTRCAISGPEISWPKVGLHLLIVLELFLQVFVLALSDVAQFSSIAQRLRLGIQENRHVQLTAQELSESS